MAEFLKKIERTIKTFLLERFIAKHAAGIKNFPFKVDSSSKILLIRLNKIGDALVTTPLISILKEKTGAQLYILADKKNHFVFSGSPYVSGVYVFEKSLAGRGKLFRELQAMEFDILVDLHDDVSNTVTMLAGRLNIPVKIALQKKSEPIYSHVVDKRNPAQFHVIERAAGLLTPFGINPSEQQLKIFLNISQLAYRNAEQRIRDAAPGSGLRVLVNISAGNPARYWGTERYKKLVQFLHAQGVQVLLTAGPAERDFTNEIMEDSSRILLTDSFTDFAAIFNYIDLLFSPDTATVHLASMFAKPVFGLYVQYNTTDMIWTPYGSDFNAVVTQEPTLANMEYDDVIKKFEPFLRKYING